MTGEKLIRNGTCELYFGNMIKMGKVRVILRVSTLQSGWDIGERILLRWESGSDIDQKKTSESKSGEISKTKKGIC